MTIEVTDEVADKLAQISAQLAHLSLELQEKKKLPPHVENRLLQFAKEKRCLFCEKALDDDPVRGCHRKCYNGMKQEIVAGAHTEIGLILMGRMGRKNPPGRKKKRPIVIQPAFGSVSEEFAVATEIAGQARAKATTMSNQDSHVTEPKPRRAQRRENR